MIIGFTGTQIGMSNAQLRFVRAFIEEAYREDSFVLGIHGDCVGADDEFHSICRIVDIPEIEIFPGYSMADPQYVSKRAFCIGDIVHDPEPFLQRNRKIVDKSSVILACPLDKKEVGGTWYTINYAKKKKKPLIIIHRDGEIQEFYRTKQ